MGIVHTVTYPEVNPEQHHAEKVEQFDYDPTGNKISETQALAPTPFHANIAKGNRLTFFSDKHFEYDRFGNLIAEKRGKDHSLVTHYQNDHLGTPIALTGSLGDTLYECQYNAYGQIIDETWYVHTF
ncbi:hypothetical protein A9G41_06275 [Gilliamella sp. Nev5-1]|uniref:RHS domain-containing protein n=1 Tax=unclassified Gilliamella TaxID=2685620 RepID=UPI00080E39FE|nr:RHS domain-containing protein [Gilliamella apicola]OCG61438.1 hypothetical protein A9G40_00075 [Gilliamella apicola]OCG69489.1 hypothetical protein A9G41_06275 [Gilliamella apicola]